MESKPLNPDFNTNQGKDVFKNLLVMETISDYLHIGDLKCLRQVSHFFRDHVSECCSFKKRVFIHVTKGTLKNENFKTFLTEHQQSKWKNMAVTLSEWGETEMELMATCHPQFFQSEVEHLKLHWQDGRKAPNNTLVTSVIFGLLCQTPKLITLEIDFSLMNTINISEAGKPIQDLFEKIPDFRIINDNPPQKISLSKFANNIAFLKKVLINLKSFSCQRFSRSKLSDKDGTKASKALVSIIMQNRLTIKSLVMLQSDIWNDSDMGIITCPSLESISARIDEGESRQLKAFLKNQTPLTGIKLVIAGSIDRQTIAIIEKFHAKTIKTLHLKARKMTGNDHDKDFFHFLKATALIDFSLTVPKRNLYGEIFGVYGTEEIVKQMPSTIQKLKIRGLVDNFQHNAVPKIQNFNFPHLQELSLICFHASGIPFVPKAPGIGELVFIKQTNTGQLPFPNLTSLELTFKRGIKFGNNNLEGISELTRLRKLQIVNYNLTDEDLKFIKFPELKSLDISRNDLLSKRAIQQMIAENPSLESIRTSRNGIRKGNGNRLTNIRFHDIVNDVVDSDSDADNSPRHLGMQFL